MNIDTNFVNLRKLIEKLKTITFFERLFSWTGIKNLFIDAFSEFEKVSFIVDKQSSEITRLESEQKLLQTQFDNLKNTHDREHDELTIFKTNLPGINSKIGDLTAQVSSKEATVESMKTERDGLNTRISSLQNDLSNLQIQYQQANDERNTLKQIEAARQTKHEQTIVSLESIKDKIEKDREAEINLQNEKEEKRRAASCT